MEAILLALSPFVIKWFTNALKPIKKLNLGQREQNLRRLGVRALVALLSLGSAIGTSLLSPEGFDPSSVSGLVTTVVETGLMFLAASGLYFFDKRKSTE